MSEPIFKKVFGSSWDKLPQVMHKHYSNRPFCNDIKIAEGKMDVSFGKVFAFFAPLFSFFKLLVPLQGVDIPVRVTFRSEKNSNALHFEREFFFDNKKPVQFFSRMIPLQKNEVVEVMSCKIGWRFSYSFERGLVLLKHRGYNLFLCGIFIPLPITFLVGVGYAQEEAISENEFRMKMTITHFLFGKIYEYKGQFKIL